MKIEINTIQAKDGTDILEIRLGDKSYRMNSIYRPRAEAQKYAEQFAQMEENSVLFVFGYGNGMIPDAIDKEYGGTIVFYEPCKDIMQYAVEHELLLSSGADEDIAYVSPYISQRERNMYVQSEFSVLLEKIITYENYKNIHYCALPKYREMFSKEYEQFAEGIQYRIRQLKANIATARFMGQEAVENNIANMRYMPESYCADSFCGLFPEDLAAVIVSAGPSLEKNVDVLKKAKKHALIICVDSAIGYLLKEQIVPDFIISVDPQKPLDRFEDDRVLGIPVIGSYDMNYRVLDRLSDSRIVFASSDNTYVQSLYSMAGHTITRLKSGGSVATMAFSVCMYWGFRNIILVGQDLALTDYQMYAGAEKIKMDNPDNNMIEVKDIYGNSIYTYSDYYAYLKWFEQIAALHTEITVIDATEGGAKIEGTRVMTLEDALEKFGIDFYDTEQIWEEVCPAFADKEKAQIELHIDQSRDKLNDLKNDLESILTILGTDGFAEEDNSQIEQEIQRVFEFYDSLKENFLIQRQIDATELDEFVSVFEQGYSESEDEKYRKIYAYCGCLKRAVDKVCQVWEKYFHL